MLGCLCTRAHTRVVRVVRHRLSREGHLEHRREKAHPGQSPALLVRTFRRGHGTSSSIKARVGPQLGSAAIRHVTCRQVGGAASPPAWWCVWEPGRGSVLGRPGGRSGGCFEKWGGGVNGNAGWDPAGRAQDGREESVAVAVSPSPCPLAAPGAFLGRVNRSGPPLCHRGDSGDNKRFLREPCTLKSKLAKLWEGTHLRPL